MGRKKKLPFIPVQFQGGQDAEFAGKQYQMVGQYINDSVPTVTEHEQLFYDSIMRLVYSNFKWYNLEDYEAHEIEYRLVNEGRVAAVQSRFSLENLSPDGIFFGAYGTDTPTTTYDFYGNPDSISVTGRNGTILRATNQDDFAVGYDTMAYYIQSPTIRPITYWAKMLAHDLADTYAAWRVAVDSRKSGLVFVVNDKREASMLRQVLSRKNNNDSYIVVEGGTFENQMQALFPNYSPDIITEFHENFMNIFGLVMDLLGLENNSTNKRERMIVSEMEMNRSLARYIGADRLAARKQFAEELNEKFGMNVKVENYLAAIVAEDGNAANEYGVEGGIGNEFAASGESGIGLQSD